MPRFVARKHLFTLRAIVQYNDLLANPTDSSLLHTTRNLNFDFLITCLIHPRTAV
jgi:hypothetical protein